jgi:galactokinase
VGFVLFRRFAFIGWLSSSASIEMATAIAMDYVYQSALPMIELVKIAKELR